MDFDEANENFIHLYEQIENHGEKFNGLTEEDTRIKIIEVILKDVLSWPEVGLNREERTEDTDHVHFTDYRLKINSRPYIVVEAKKTSIEYLFPKIIRRTIKVKSLLNEKSNIASSIKQVREYCDESGVRFAIATNGYSWIAFKSIRDDIPWKEGKAIVFVNLIDIKTNFIEFYNYFSYENINKNQLDKTFSSQVRKKRNVNKVLDRMHSADKPLERNRLHTYLDQVIESYFKDIADNEYIQLLKDCYVYSEDDSFNRFSAKIRDEIPSFLKDTNIDDIKTTQSTSGSMAELMHESAENISGKLLLILGGIGAGKTTFLKRFFRLTDADFLNLKAVWFYISFLGPPSNYFEIDKYIYEKILQGYRSNYTDLLVEDRKNIKKAYSDVVERLNKTIFEPEKLSADEIERRLTPFIVEWQSDIKEYTKRLLKLFERRTRAVIICLDNVDQLPPKFQEQVFLAAQNVHRELNSIVILALREETYYTARTQKTFTAYSNQKFHIVSPDFIRLIGKRINFAKNDLSKKENLISNKIRMDGQAQSDILDFIEIIEKSLFEKNKSLVKFINAICFGNMRLALEYFSKFLLSGATYVDKMLNIYRVEGRYNIPFHEFIKSIMIDDRVYYRDSKSTILNIYNCGIDENSSHFTSIRILKFLRSRESIYSSEGSGFVSIDSVLDVFEEVFNNRTDVIETCNRMLNKSLIETNTKATDEIANSSHIRITKAGIYYIVYLIKKFVYLDLVLMDTPINDDQVRNDLFKVSVEIERIPDYQKHEKTIARFSRTEIFLAYLTNEENEELDAYHLISEYDDFKDKIMDSINDTYIKDKNWILDTFARRDSKNEVEELREE